MTHPEKEFELGSFWDLRGVKMECVGITSLFAMGAFKNTAGHISLCYYKELTEWKQDPKPKFEDEREAIAVWVRTQLGLTDESPIVKRIRALTPDPAAAVAGSAEPVGYWRKVISFQDEAEFLSPGRWEGLSKYDQGIYTPVYPAPSPLPQPNPVEREARCIGYMSAIALGDLADLFKTGSNATWVGVMTKQAMGEVTVPIYTIPPVISSEFDEAAERKLFEAELPESYLRSWEENEHHYVYSSTQLVWRYWLSSAKVHRGQLNPVGREAWETEYWTLISPDGKRWVEPSALDCVRAEQRERIPASVRLDRLNKFLNDSEPLLHDLVAEVRKELEKVADRYADSLDRVCMPAEILRSLAAKLGSGK